MTLNALALARVLAQHKRYDPALALKAYVDWLNYGPFDCGFTTRSGLLGKRDQNSQANGAMMRISPLGIFGANYESEQVAEWACEDAKLTHPHPVCQQANSLYASAIACAVRTGCEPQELYERIKTWAGEYPSGADAYVGHRLRDHFTARGLYAPTGLGSDGVPQPH